MPNEFENESEDLIPFDYLDNEPSEYDLYEYRAFARDVA